MKLTFKNIVRITLFTILSLWAFDFIKILKPEIFIHDGTSYEYYNIVIDIGLSCLFYAFIIRFIMDTLSRFYKDEIKLSHVHIIPIIIILSIMFYVYCFIPTQEQLLTDTKYSYQLLFNPMFILIDFIFIGLSYLLSKSELGKYFMSLFFIKNFTILAIYLIFVSFVSFSNTGANSYDNRGTLNPTIFKCKNTYVKYSPPFSINTTQCPNIGKTETESLIRDANEGSYIAYAMTVNRLDSYVDKAELVMAYYRSNEAKFSKPLWLEEHNPALYAKTELKTSKDNYLKYKNIDTTVAKMIIDDKISNIDAIKNNNKELSSPLLMSIK